MITVTRETTFTDYDCNEAVRPIVSIRPIGLANDGPVSAHVEIARGPNYSTCIDYDDPEMLRSLAAVLTAAADAWTREAGGA